MIEEEFGITIEEITSKITNGLVESLPDRVISVFLMGSSARGEINPILQDLDFIVVLRDDIRAKHLSVIKQVTERVCQEYNSEEVAVYWIVKDGPWKPEITAKHNIGIHLNIQCLTQQWRRSFHEINLAMSMFPYCKVLHGKHPLSIFPVGNLSAKETLTNMFGISWLKSLLTTASVLLDWEKQREAIFEVLQYSVLCGALNFEMVIKGASLSRQKAVELFLEDYKDREDAKLPLLVLQIKREWDVARIPEVLERAIPFLTDLVSTTERI